MYKSFFKYEEVSILYIVIKVILIYKHFDNTHNIFIKDLQKIESFKIFSEYVKQLSFLQEVKICKLIHSFNTH